MPTCERLRQKKPITRRTSIVNNYCYYCFAHRVLLTLTLLVGVFAPPAAWSSSVTLAVGSVEGAPGSRVEVPIDVRAAQQLGALQMELVYDPDILEPLSVETGTMSQDVTVDHNIVAPGRLRIVMNASARESVSGDGTLIKAVFTVKGTNQQRCELTLEQVQAWDNTRPDAPPYEMLVTVESGAFTVGGSSPSAGWIAALCVALVILLLVIGVVAAGKSRRAAGAHSPPKHSDDVAS